MAGTDMSEHARAQASELGISLKTDPELVEGPADVLAAFQILEHMPDPLPALQHGVELLRPGGLVIAESWDRSHWMARMLGRRWQQVSSPSVLHLFSRTSLTRLASGQA